MNNFMAIVKKCEKCGKEYLEAHQSAECPHKRLVDMTERLNKEELVEKIADFDFEQDLVTLADFYEDWLDVENGAENIPAELLDRQYETCLIKAQEIVSYFPDVEQAKISPDKDTEKKVKTILRMLIRFVKNRPPNKPLPPKLPDNEMFFGEAVKQLLALTANPISPDKDKIEELLNNRDFVDEMTAIVSDAICEICGEIGVECMYDGVCELTEKHSEDVAENIIKGTLKKASISPDKLTRKQILSLPLEERRKILEQQANDPKVIEYYNTEGKPN